MKKNDVLIVPKIFNSDLVIQDISKNQIAELFKKDQINPILDELERLVSSHVPDISTKDGRKKIISLAGKVASSKTYLDGLGKELKSEFKIKCDEIDAERKKIKTRLDALKISARKPVTDWENKETERLKKHENNLSKIKHFLFLDFTFLTSCEIKKESDELMTINVDASWEEFEMIGLYNYNKALERLNFAYDKQLDHEAMIESNKKLEAERLDRERKNNEAKIAKDAREEAEKNAKIEADKKERQRIDAIAKIEREKQKIIDEKNKLERQKIDNIAKAKKRELELKEKAKLDKIALIAKAKKEQEEALERQRQAQIDKDNKELKEKQKREENITHVKKINNEVLTYLLDNVNMEKKLAIELITAIAKNKIKNVKINY